MGVEDPEKKNQPGGETEEARRKEEMRRFVQEIATLRRVDEAGGWRVVHLKDVNPHELTYEDSLIYRSARNETVTSEEFEEYKRKIIDQETGEPRKGISQNRLNFLAFIANRINLFLLRKEQEKKEREKKGRMQKNDESR